MTNLLKLFGPVGGHYDIDDATDWKRAFSLTPSPGQLERVQLWLDPARPETVCSIDGRLVQSIDKAAGDKPLVVKLKVPSPIPGGAAPYGADLLIVLQRAKFDEPWWQECASGQWLEASGNRAIGTLNGWMYRDTLLHKRQRPNDYQFPLGPDGLALIGPDDRLPWIRGDQAKDELYAQLGIMRIDSGELVLMYSPRGEIQGHKSDSSPGLLDQERLVFSARVNAGRPVYTQAPLVMAYSLASKVKEDGWDLFVQWRALSNGDPNTRLLPCLFEHLVDIFWNDTVREVGAGRRIEQTLAWLPLPTIRSVSASKAHALIALERKTRPGSTRAVNLLAEGPVAERLQLDCEFLGIAVSGTLKPHVSLPSWHSSLKFTTLPVESLAADDMRTLWEKRRASETGADTVADWSIELDHLQSAGAASVVLGSMELRFAAGALAPRSASANCQLHGIWKLDQRQLHPEFTLTLPCEFRPSGAADQGQEMRTAQFDTANEREDRLQRASGPIMFQGADAAWRSGTLTLRYKSQRGFDAVTEMVLSSSSGATTLDASALYLQLRPFMVARMHPVRFDPQAGSRIAEWRSDDREGPQWRLADATVDLELPPQAVGEEMERGKRFWPGGSPTIRAGKKALRYRFAPPTRLLVRPSATRARRYNISPYNLMDALRQGKVEHFSTELVYPIQTSFAVDLAGMPDVRIAETSLFIGQPAPNLPTAPTHPDEYRSWLGRLYDPSLADWVARMPEPQLHQLRLSYQAMRQRHSAARMNIVARLAEHHLYDPWRRDGKLMLRDGLQSVVRGTAMGAPPLLQEVLPNATSLSEKARRSMAGFLDPNHDWAQLKDGPDSVGALSAGALYTMEFAAELLAVLRTPLATETVIEHLSFTALGANAHFAVSFDEGRTTFTVDVRHGQVARLVKTRIGRVALLWNTAKHVVIYQREVLPSEQFKDEQYEGEHDSAARVGWPILRKWEEYVEPIERIRKFGDDKQKQHHAAGFVDGAEFITPRIYVNGAWGRDLRANPQDEPFGYELPLWNEVDSSDFYPMPSVALRVVADPAVIGRAPIKRPQHLYFYSNTEAGTGNDPDRWEAKDHVDGERTLARLPPLTGHGAKIGDPRSASSLSARPAAFSRPRFDLEVLPVAAANLQHQRGTEQILAKLDVITLSRVADQEATPIDQVAALLAQPIAINRAASEVASIEEKLHRLLARLPALALDVHLGCDTIKARMLAELDRGFAELADGMDTLPTPDFTQIVKHATESAFAQLRATLQQEVRQRLAAPVATLAALERPLLAAIDDALRLPLAELAQERASLVRTLGLHLAAIRSVVIKAEADTTRFLQDVSENALTLLYTQLDKIETAIGTVSATFDGWDISAGLDPLRADALQKIDTVNAAIAPVLAQLEQLLRTRVPALPGCGRPAVAQAMLLADTARTALTTLQQQLGTIRKEIADEDTLDALRRLLQEAFLNATGTLTQALKSARLQVGHAARLLAALLGEVLAKLKSELQAAHASAAALVTLLDAAAARLDASLGAGEEALKNVLAELRQNLARETGAIGQKLALLVQSYADKLTNVFDSATFRSSVDELTAVAMDAARGANDYVRTLDIGGKQRRLSQWLGAQYDSARALIENLDCGALDAVAAAVHKEIDKVISDVRQRVTGVLTEAFDDATRHQFEQLAGTAQAAYDTMGKGIKLVKAIGELPALPTLTFNAERAEYVFEDFKKQIDTSPFVARLREVGDGLQDLGLSLPSRALLDQFIPDDLKDLDFSSVFNKVAGVDFAEFFQRFKLPQIDRKDLQLLHGIDQASRSAWVKTAIHTRFPGENELLDIGPMAIKVKDLLIDAHSNTRISLSGERQSDTDAKLTGDWALEFGGTMLARFRQVTISYDGSGFGFDVSPANIELHPALKFVSEFAKRFGDSLPPSIEIERDQRGMPIGARTSIVTEIKDLPPLGVVTIGPLRIAAGLGLRVARDGKFVVNTHVSVGSRSTPIFVQIGYLGGGMYLEARAEAVGGAITYAATVGLSLGSMRALNFAAVARGHYSILLFASADIDNRGGAFRAGLTFDGSARILGMCNASITVLLEAVHSGGKTEGRGELHVEVEICWCYTLRVHRAVTQNI